MRHMKKCELMKYDAMNYSEISEQTKEERGNLEGAMRA
jgi:hypothetical protein